MIEILPIKEELKNDVLNYMHLMYNSSAVDHVISDEVLIKTINAAINKENNFYGYAILYENKVKGFGFLTRYFSSEVGDFVVQFEDLYIDEKLRSKGIGSLFFNEMINKFKAKRYRLEVTKNNLRAIELYKKLGFNFLEYKQMIRDEV